MFGILLAGCVTTDSPVVTAEEFSASVRAQKQARLLRSGDRVYLSVEVKGKKEIPQTTIQVNHDGSIPVPFVGDVKLDGLTLAEARLLLEKSYSRIFVTAPLITFGLVDDGAAGEWGYVTVLGQVRNPGRFSVMTSAGMNLSEALHEAGGFGDSANMNEIVVTRVAPDGKTIQYIADIKAFGRSGSTQQDIVLFDGDVVYVPERLF